MLELSIAKFLEFHWEFRRGSYDFSSHVPGMLGITEIEILSKRKSRSFVAEWYVQRRPKVFAIDVDIQIPRRLCVSYLIRLKFVRYNLDCDGRKYRRRYNYYDLNFGFVYIGWQPCTDTKFCLINRFLDTSSVNVNDFLILIVS